MSSGFINPVTLLEYMSILIILNLSSQVCLRPFQCIVLSTFLSQKNFSIAILFLSFVFPGFNVLLCGISIICVLGS